MKAKMIFLLKWTIVFAFEGAWLIVGLLYPTMLFIGLFIQILLWGLLGIL